MQTDHAVQERNRGGFTLVEVLVSSAILLVLAVLLLGMSHSATKFWSDSEGRREALRELQSSLQIMTEDLHSAVITQGGDDFQVRHPEEKDQSLFFLVSHHAHRRDPDTRGDLCAVGYFLAQSPKEHGSMNLYRFHAAGESVSKAVESHSLDSLYNQAWAQNPGQTELLGRNVVSLRVRRVPELTASADLLEIILTAINSKTARLLASDPAAAERNIRILKERELKASALVRLPPCREPGAQP